VLAVAIGAATLDRVMLSLALGRRQHGWLFLRRDGSFPQALPRVQPLFTAASVISPYFVGLSAVRAHAAVRMIAIPVSFLVGISRVYLVCTGQLTQSAAGFSLSRGSGSSCWRRPCSSGLLCCPRLFGGCKVSSPALLISKTQPVLAVEIILRFLVYSVWPPVSIVRTTTSPVFTPTRASTGIPPSARVRGWALAQQDRLEEGIAVVEGGGCRRVQRCDLRVSGVEQRVPSADGVLRRAISGGAARSIRRRPSRRNPIAMALVCGRL
jgi:hypothetical protein